MPRVVRVVEPPTDEPVSLERARRHLRLMPYGDDPPAHFEDPWIVETLPQCREWCEAFTGLTLAPRTLEVAHDFFVPIAALPLGPVLSIESVKYTDPEGKERTVEPSVYDLDLYREPALLALRPGQNWPAARCTRNAVRMSYRAGFAAPGDGGPDKPEIPGPIVSALLLLLGHLFENREATVPVAFAAQLPLGVDALLRPYRVSPGI